MNRILFNMDLPHRSRLTLLLLFLLLSLLQVTHMAAAKESEGANILNTSDLLASSGSCAMYDICGMREDGKPLNCANNTQAIKPEALLSAKIQSLCPTITGDVCCTSGQFDILRNQVQQVVPFLVGCPACLRNFLNLFCELSCSPDQGTFINLTSVIESGNKSTVKAIDFFVSEMYGEKLYESCKDVKFGAMNTRAMDFVGGGATNFKEWLSFMGKEAGLHEPGSPFSINFITSDPHSDDAKPLNGSIIPCWDPSLSCSCGDCPSASFCSDISPSAGNATEHCSLQLGLFKVRCIDFAVTILYILVLGAIFALIFANRMFRDRHLSSSDVPLLSEKEDNELLPLNDEEDAASLQVVSRTAKVHRPVVMEFMSNIFRSHGMWVARNCGLVLILAGFIMVVLCLGLMKLEIEADPEKLWVSPGSKAATEKEFFDTHLAPFYRIEQLILATVPSKGESKAPTIISNDNILLMFEIQKKVDKLQGNHSGKLVKLDDICMKPVGSACATQSILQYFKMDSQQFDDYGGSSHAIFCFEHYSSSAQCLGAYEAPVDPSTVLGSFSGSNYSEATAFVVTYPVSNFVGNSSEVNAAAIAWEEAFIELAKEELTKMAENHNLTLSFSAEISIQKELERESTADAVTILISYLVMFAYISFTLGDSSPSIPFYVTSKVLLGLAGVVIVALSVLGSVGVFSAFGVKSTLIIAEVIPFLVLAVGVDNMCILVHAVKRRDSTWSPERRIGDALAEVGPSIALASLAETLAFAVGSITPMPACRVFSMFAALAVFIDFLLQLTAFVALLTYDLNRTKDNRVDCFPCIVVPSPAYDEAEDVSSNHHQRPGILAQYMKKIHAPILRIMWVKVVVIAVFIGLTLTSIALTARVSPGLEQQVVLPRDSYLQGYFNDVTEHLRIGPPLYFVVQDYNYSLSSNHTNLLCSINNCDPSSLLNEISRAAQTPATSFIAKPAASWLDDFLVWLSPDAFGCCRTFTDGKYCPPDDQPPCCGEDEDYCGISETCKDCTTCFLHSDLHNGRPTTDQFREKIPWFLSALPSADCSKGGVGAYSDTVDLHGYESGVIKASSFRTYHTPLNKQSDFIDSMKAAMDFSARVSKSINISIFPYAKTYIFFEQYLDIWGTTLKSLSLALGAVFIVCAVIFFSLWSAGIILLVLVMIIVDMLGLMALMNVQLNAISVVNLSMSVGIAVEFCVHLTQSFVVRVGNREERITHALTTMGASVFSGITITKFVGVIVLYFSRSEIFEVYYFRMYLALVILGFLHGLVLLPVLLSVIGPPPFPPMIDSKNPDAEVQIAQPENLVMGVYRMDTKDIPTSGE